MRNVRVMLAVGMVLGFCETAGAVSFRCTQSGPNTWVYTLTFAPLDNFSVTQPTTTITLNGLTGVTAASGPTSTDFPAGGPANAANLNWTAQVKNSGTTVVWSNTNGGTGNFSTVQHAFGFSVTANAPNGTVALATSGFSRDTPNPLPGGGLNLDVTGSVAGPASTTSVVLPQLVFGGSWYSAVYFTNTGTTNAQFTVNFISDSGAPMPIPNASSQTSIPLTLGPEATAVIEIPNAGTFNQGYATALIPAGVQGYGVFRQSVPGIPDQEAVVPLSIVSDVSETLIYDDTHYITAVAIANPTAATITVAISAVNSSGVSAGAGTIALAPFTHTAIALRSIAGMSGIAGQRGAATFTVANGNLSVLGLRFNGSAFTSIPAAGK